MEKKDWEGFVVMVAFMMLSALAIFFFYNCTIAWNFNLPEFTYWEILLGIFSGRVLLRCLFHKFY